MIRFCFVSIIFLTLLSACNDEEFKIASIENLSVKIYDDAFRSTPIVMDNKFFLVVKNNSDLKLVSFDFDGRREEVCTLLKDSVDDSSYYFEFDSDDSFLLEKTTDAFYSISLNETSGGGAGGGTGGGLRLKVVSDTSIIYKYTMAGELIWKKEYFISQADSSGFIIMNDSTIQTASLYGVFANSKDEVFILSGYERKMGSYILSEKIDYNGNILKTDTIFVDKYPDFLMSFDADGEYFLTVYIESNNLQVNLCNAEFNTLLTNTLDYPDFVLYSIYATNESTLLVSGSYMDTSLGQYVSSLFEFDMSFKLLSSYDTEGKTILSMSNVNDGIVMTGYNIPIINLKTIDVFNVLEASDPKFVWGKIDNSGKILWTRTLNNDTPTLGLSSAVDENGNYVFLAATRLVLGETGIMIVKTDENGEILN